MEVGRYSIKRWNEGAASGKLPSASVRRLNTKVILTLLGFALAQHPVPHPEKLRVRDPIGVVPDPSGHLGPQPHPSEMMLKGTGGLSTAKVLSNYWKVEGDHWSVWESKGDVMGNERQKEIVCWTYACSRALFPFPQGRRRGQRAGGTEFHNSGNSPLTYHRCRW